MIPSQRLLDKIRNPHEWVALSKDECHAIHMQIDSMTDTLDVVSILLYKLDIYLPEDTYPNKLVKDALVHINKYWSEFLPHEYTN